MTRREIGLLAAGLSGGVFAGFVAATILLAPAAELPHPQPSEQQPTPAHSCAADEVSDECPGWIDWYVDDWKVPSTDR